ncbi:hypothetical protein AK830_g2509 [Neonectria ditissima]|uniref:Uncharacterized protein n=1 Tax=Neonectria ditissima TaxID=78410 RepID=A0A0P7BEQ2_9HYPO|nr:hypothetical protein AK830_g2509 [Neonectria ditissima]
MGIPRLGKYEKLLSRFFETLILMSTLRRVVGPHTLNPLDSSTLTACRRRFIKNLAFICDHSKGGGATTSVAIEDRAECFVFWVASNEELGRNVTSFLESILATLRDANTQNDPNFVARSCAEFSNSRIQKESKILSNAAKKCVESLNSLDSTAISKTEGTSLVAWLRKLKFEKKADPFETCQVAYNARNDPQVQTLRKLGQESLSSTGSMVTADPFRTVKHMIGRLAEHIRVAEQLLEDSNRLHPLLDEYRVDTVQLPVCVPPPEADSQTSLNGILKRMLPAGDKRVGDYESYLAQMGVEDQINDKYEKQASKPCVHAEIQMHEHFYRNRLVFADGDRFIGTSKFACYCCKLYFRHHRAGYVEPDSHEKVYLNWGPIALPQGQKDPRWIELRDVMILVRKDLCDIVLRQVERQQTASISRPDSMTGITRSENEVFEDVYELSDLEDEFFSESAADEGEPRPFPPLFY